MSCSCLKKQKQLLPKNGDKTIENFSYDATKNMCHYTCASINTTNIILCVLVLLLLYLIAHNKS